jgi:hypothetical protein
MDEALPRILLAAAVVLSAYFICEGVTSLLRADLRASEPRAAQTRPPSVAPPVRKKAPDMHAVLASTVIDTKKEPARPPPARRALPIEDNGKAQPAGRCDGDLRIAGSAYVRPSAGEPLVLFSGAGVGKGLRGIGSQVAGKTLVAIYPTAVVLRDPSGRECWVKMSSAHAREVAGQERRAAVRAAQDRHREEQRAKALARRKARIAKRKKR